MASNVLGNMLNANCGQLLTILAFDGDINPEIKPSLYMELESILDAIDDAGTIDATNFNTLRERTLNLKRRIDELKSMEEDVAVNVADK
jgi:hypothetical protein